MEGGSKSVFCLVLRGLLFTALMVVAASCLTPDTAGNRSTTPAPRALPKGFRAYLVPSAPVDILTVPPKTLLAKHARPLDQTDTQAIAFADEAFYNVGNCHVFRLPNLGDMRVVWSGFVEGNSRVQLSYWDGKTFISRYFEDASGPKIYGLQLSAPPSEKYVYIVVYCPHGTLHSNGLEFRPQKPILTPLKKGPNG